MKKKNRKQGKHKQSMTTTAAMAVLAANHTEEFRINAMRKFWQPIVRIPHYLSVCKQKIKTRKMLLFFIVFIQFVSWTRDKY